MNTIIALETATSCCSAALRIDGEIIERAQVGSNVHSQVLLAMVQELLTLASIKPEQLDAVAVGQGPGSFTGLRIGVGVGQGLAYGSGCPMVGISSLAALALAAANDGVVIAGIDARMGEIYWGKYQKADSSVVQLAPLKVSPPNLLSREADLPAADAAQLVGNAWPEYWDKFDSEFRESQVLNKEIIYPGAAKLLVLAEQKFQRGDVESAIEFQPIYVRNDVAKKSTKKY